MADQVGTDTKSGAQPDDGALTGTTMGGTVAEAGAQPGHYEAFHGRPVSWVAVGIIMVAFVVGGLIALSTNIFEDWY